MHVDVVLPHPVSVRLQLMGKQRDVFEMSGRYPRTHVHDVILLADAELVQFAAMHAELGWEHRPDSNANEWNYVGNMIKRMVKGHRGLQNKVSYKV
jgi:hypothetical protein